jgi:hypothetical protein
LAAVVNRSPEETLVPVRNRTTARVTNGLVHWDTPFPADRARRALQVGDREISMNRCAAAVFVYPVVLDVPFQVKETCPATGRTIRATSSPAGTSGSSRGTLSRPCSHQGAAVLFAASENDDAALGGDHW